MFVSICLCQQRHFQLERLYVDLRVKNPVLAAKQYRLQATTSRYSTDFVPGCSRRSETMSSDNNCVEPWQRGYSILENIRARNKGRATYETLFLRWQKWFASHQKSLPKLKMKMLKRRAAKVKKQDGWRCFDTVLIRSLWQKWRTMQKLQTLHHILHAFWYFYRSTLQNIETLSKVDIFGDRCASRFLPCYLAKMIHGHNALKGSKWKNRTWPFCVAGESQEFSDVSHWGVIPDPGLLWILPELQELA